MYLTVIKYFIPNSECTPFNCLFHCDSTVLSPSVPQVGVTALMCASDGGHTYVVQLLLSSGAQVDLQGKVRHNINLRAGVFHFQNTCVLLSLVLAGMLCNL